LQERSKRKKRRSQNLRRTRSLLLFTIILGLVFGWSPIVSFIKPLVGLGNAQLERINSVSFAGNDVSGFNSVYVVNDQICILEKESVRVYSSAGEFLSEEPFISVNPIIKSNGEHILLSDLTLGEYLIIDPKGTVIKDAHDLGNLENIWLTSDHTILTLKNERKQIQMINHEKETDVTVEIPSGKIIDVTYSEADERMAVIVFDTDKTPYESVVYQYSPSGELKGASVFPDAILYDAKYDLDGLLVIGDQNIALINAFTETMWDKPIKGIVNKYAWNPKWIILNTIISEEMITDIDQKNQLELYTWTGDIMNTFEIEMDIEGINSDHSQYIICFGKQDLLILNKNGEVIIKKSMRSPIQKIEWVQKNRLAVVFNNEVDLLDLVY